MFSFEVHRSNPNAPLLVIIMCCILGIGCFYGSYQAWNFKNKFEARAVIAEATVIDYYSYERVSTDDEGNRDTHTVYHPVFKYSYRDSLYTQYQHDYSRTKEFEVNEVVSLLIDTEDPTFYRLNSFWGRWSDTIMWLFFALFAIILPLFLFKNEIRLLLSTRKRM
jgi:hypothetical protein